MDVTINGVRYSSNDAEISFLGRFVTGVVELNFKEVQEVNPVRVVGNRKTVGHVRGNYGVEGNIILLMEEVLGLQVSGGGSILNLPPFPITWILNKDGILVKESLQNVVLKENGREFKGGAAEAIQVDIPFWASEFRPFTGV